MSKKILQVYGPYSHDCGPFGRLTNLLLWFVRTVYIHETLEATVVYKYLRGDMYVFGVVRKQSQGDKARLS